MPTVDEILAAARKGQEPPEPASALAPATMRPGAESIPGNIPAPPAAPLSPAAAPSSPVDAILARARDTAKEEEELDATFQAWKVGQSDLTPDQGLEVLHLAKATGKPVPFVASNLEALRKEVDEARLRRAFLESPTLQRYMADPATAGTMKTKDRLDDWSTWEWLLGKWDAAPSIPSLGGLEPGVTLKEAPAWAQAARGGWAEAIEIPMLAARVMRGDATDEDKAELERLEKEYGGRTYGAKTALGKAAIGIPKLVPYVVASGLARAAGGALGGFGAGAATAGAGTPVGIVAGQYVGGAAFDFVQNVGPLYLQLRRIKGADGAPLLGDEEAKSYATLTSLGLAAATSGLGGQAVKSVPWVKDLLQRQAARGVEEAFTRVGGAAALKAFGKAYPTHVASGAAMMAAQAAGNAAAVELAKGQHGVTAEWENVSQAAKEAALQGMQEMALLAAWGPGRDFLRRRGLEGMAEAQAARYQAIADHATRSPIVADGHERAEGALDAISLAQSAPDILADPAHWDTYWAGKGLDPRKIAAELAGDGGKGYDEVKAGIATDLAFPVAKWTARLGKTEHILGLAEDVRMSGDARTPRQEKVWREETLPKLVEAAKAKVSDWDEQLAGVEHAKFLEVLDAAPRLGPAHATAIAQIFRAAVSEFSAMSEKSPADFLQEFPLTIRSEAKLPPALKLTPERQAPESPGVAVEPVRVDAPLAAAQAAGEKSAPAPDAGRALDASIVQRAFSGDRAAILELARRAKVMPPEEGGGAAPAAPPSESSRAGEVAHIRLDDGTVVLRQEDPPRHPDRTGHEIKGLDGRDGRPAIPLNLPQEDRGRLRFQPPDSPAVGVEFDLSLLKNANESTAAHELGHWQGIVLGQLASRPNANPELVRLYRTALDWMGYADHGERVSSLLELQRLAAKGDKSTEGEVARRKDLEGREEKLSRAFEAYLAEGRAPTVELARTFTRFKLWMTRIYSGIRGVSIEYRRQFGRDLELSPEVRQMFDRILGANEAMRSAEAATEAPRRAQVVAALREVMPAEGSKLGQDLDDARREAQETLERVLIAEDAKERKTALEDERAKLRTEVEAELDAQPAYQAQRFLREGRMPEGVELPPELVTDAGAPRMLDRAEVVARYGQEWVNRNLRGMTIADPERSIPMDLLAEAFGVASGDELVGALAGLAPRAETVRSRVEARMFEVHGPPLLENPGELGKRALAAVHNESAVRAITTGMRILARKLEPALELRFRALDLKDVEAKAESLVRSRPLREVSETQALRAERAAAKRAIDLLGQAVEAKTEAGRRSIAARAFDAHEEQLLHFYVWKASAEAAKTAESDLGFLRPFLADKKRADLAKAGPDYLQRVDDLLGSIELRTSTSVAEVRRRSEINAGAGGDNQAAAAMVAWLEEQRALNRDPIVSPGVLDRLRRTTHWRELSADELKETRDTVESIAHLATLKNSLLVAGERRDRRAAIEEIGQRLRETFGEQEIVIDRNTIAFKRRVLKSLAKLKAGVIRPEEFFREADGGDPNGPLTKYLWNPISDSYGRWNDLVDRVAKPVTEVLEAMPAADKARWRNTRFTVKGQGYTLEAALSVALNWGNLSNRKKLVEGWQHPDLDLFRLPKWDGEKTAQEFLRHLTTSDWTLVQKIWDSLETMWPEMEALEKRMTGLAPPKVARAPFEVTTADGETLKLDGGYYPMVYDRRFSGQGARQEEASTIADFRLFSPGAERAITPHGHLSSRVERFSRPVELSVIGLYRHLSHATKDIAMREALISVHDIVTDQRFRAAIELTAGEEMMPVLEKWVRDTANDLVIPDGGEGEWLKINTATRAGLTGSIFALNAAQSLQNLTGVANAMDRVNAGFMWRGIERLMSERGDAIAFIRESSAEMRGRAKSIDRDLAAEMKRTLGRSGPLTSTKQAMMWAFEASDAVVANATWLGAYHQAIAGKVPELALHPVEGEGPISPADHEAAVRWADSTVRLSLTSGAVKDLPALMRSPQAKWFTMFMGWTNARLNRLFAASAVAKADIRDKEYGRALRRATRITFWFMAGAVLSDLVVGKGASDENEDGTVGGGDWAKWMARRVALAPFSIIPLAGPVIRTAADVGRDVSLAPVERVYSSVAKTLWRGGKAAKGLVTGEGEWTEDLAAFGANALWTAAMTTGLPVSQVRATSGYWLDPDRDRSDQAGEVVLGTLFGKARKGSLSTALYGED